jgi:hypothetical protein
MFAIACVAIALFASCANPSSSSSGSSSGTGTTTPVVTPTVTLTVTNGSNESTTSIYSDEPAKIKAIVANLPGTALTYAWYIDGAKQDKLTTDTISGSTLASVQKTQKFTVIVSNGTTSATGNVTITLMPAASLKIENNSSASIDKLFFSTLQTNGSTSTLYSDENFTFTSYTSSKLSANYIWTFWNIKPGMYYLRADLSTGYYWYQPNGITFSNGVRKTWKISDTAASVENRKGSLIPNFAVAESIDESSVSEGFSNYVPSAK